MELIINIGMKSNAAVRDIQKALSQLRDAQESSQQKVLIYRNDPLLTTENWLDKSLSQFKILHTERSSFLSSDEKTFHQTTPKKDKRSKHKKKPSCRALSKSCQRYSHQDLYKQRAILGDATKPQSK